MFLVDSGVSIKMIVWDGFVSNLLLSFSSVSVSLLAPSEFMSVVGRHYFARVQVQVPILLCMELSRVPECAGAVTVCNETN